MKDILLTANRSNAETFYKFYHKKVVKDRITLILHILLG
jgi:hypothetical protein